MPGAHGGGHEVVIPAEAGIQGALVSSIAGPLGWVPAFAGMTDQP